VIEIDGKPEHAPPAEWVRLDLLEVWGDNPRNHPRGQVNKIKASIKANGWGEPILAHRPSRRIIAGHGRRLAYMALQRANPDFTLADAPGPGFVPVRWIDGPWSRAAAALALASNHASEGAEDDDAVLRRVLRELHAEEDVGRRALGLDDERIALLLEEDERTTDPDRPRPGNRTDGDDDLEPPKDPVSRVGEVYLLGPHVLVCGDSLLDTRVGENGAPPPIFRGCRRGRQADQGARRRARGGGRD
jgi:hypothetical protein